MNRSDLTTQQLDVIRSARRAKGWRQADLAAAMTSRGVPGWGSKMTACKLELGDRGVTYNECRTLLDVLGISQEGFETGIALTQERREGR